MDPFSSVTRATHDHLSAETPYEILLIGGALPSERFSADMHYALQFGVVLEGCVQMRYQDCDREVGAGQVWWASCWEPHGSRVREAPFDSVVVNMNIEYLCAMEALDDISWITPFMIRPELRPAGESKATRREILRIGRGLREIGDAPGFGSRTLGWLKVHELIMLLAVEAHEEGRDAVVQTNAQYLRILPAIELVRRRLGEAVSVEEAAEACGLGRSRFCQVFTNVMGCGLHQFMLKARTACAAQDLRQTRLPVKSVALKWGFVDHSHFHHTFRRFFDCTPNEYRVGHGGEYRNRRFTEEEG